MLSTPYSRAIALCLIPAIGLVLLALAVQALAAGDPLAVWPGVITLLTGAAVSQLAVVVCIVGMIRHRLAGEQHAASWTTSVLRAVPWILLGALVAVAMWRATISLGEGITAVVFALVAGQAYFAFAAARRQFVGDDARHS